MKEVMILGTDLVRKAQRQYKLLCSSLNGCSFGEAIWKFENNESVDFDNRVIEFTHGVLKGKAYQNRNQVMLIEDSIKILNATTHEFTEDVKLNVLVKAAYF